MLVTTYYELSSPPLHKLPPFALVAHTTVKIGTGIGTIPAGCLTDSIAVGRWPVRGSAGRTGRTQCPGSDSEEQGRRTGKEGAGMSLKSIEQERREQKWVLSRLSD